jgi:hypothetical protein
MKKTTPATGFSLNQKFRSWPNSALNSSEIPVQWSSAIRSTADIVRRQVRMAATDPEKNSGHLIG